MHKWLSNSGYRASKRELNFGSCSFYNSRTEEVVAVLHFLWLFSANLFRELFLDSPLHLKALTISAKSTGCFKQDSLKQRQDTNKYQSSLSLQWWQLTTNFEDASDNMKHLFIHLHSFKTDNCWLFQFYTVQTALNWLFCLYLPCCTKWCLVHVPFSWESD